MTCHNLVYDFNIKLSTGSGDDEDVLVNKNIALSKAMDLYYVDKISVPGSGTFTLNLQSITTGSTLIVVPDTSTDVIGIKVSGAPTAINTSLWISDITFTSVIFTNAATTATLLWVLFAKKST